MSGTQRAVLLVLAAILAAAAFVVLKPSDDDGQGERTTEVAVRETTARARPAPKPPRIRVRSGEAVGGVRRIEAEKGQTVRFTVSSDSPGRVHLHGYDVILDAAPGAPARFEFRADLEGVFEVELEETHVQVGELRVEP